MNKYDPDRVLTVNVPFDIKRERIADLLTSALEGGSTYWCDYLEVDEWPQGAKYAAEAIASGWTAFSVRHDDEVTRVGSQVPVALKRLATEFPEQFELFLMEQDDAETGDIFFQLLCFGEIVYG
jgi:hypothetical protein